MSILGKGIAGAGYLLTGKLTARAFTFVGNVVLTRSLPAGRGPALIGLSRVALQLQFMLALEIAREGARRAALRTHVDMNDSAAVAHILSVVWRWSVCFGFIAIAAVHSLFTWFHDEVASGGEAYGASISIVSLAAALELLAEPLYVLFALRLQYRARSIVEGAAMIARCAITIYLVLVRGQVALESFAWGFAAYSCTIFVSYVTMNAVWPSKHNVLAPAFAWTPSSPSTKQFFSLARSLSFQSLWKVLLAQGAKVAMVTFKADPHEQGVYALVNNLGSIVARFIFQPLEEIAYTVFGKMNDSRDRARVPALFRTLLKTMLLFGILFLCFGTEYTHLLLRVLYGEAWANTSAPKVLAWYCAYVLLMATNGITEALVHAVADRSTLSYFNAWLIVCSVCFVIASGALLPLGAVGLVFANCINMLSRIFFSGWYILTAQDLKSATRGLFSRPFVGTLLISSIIMLASNKIVYAYRPVPAVLHVSIGAACFAACSASLVRSEKEYLQRLRRVWSSRSGGSEKEE